jgi:hypothetical protein
MEIASYWDLPPPTELHITDDKKASTA